jgi:hypothetical protein
MEGRDMATADPNGTLAKQVEDILAAAREAMRPLTLQIKRIGAAFAHLSRTAAQWDADLLLERRRTFGGNGRDAEKYPDEWQSIQCSSWLPNCPSDEYDLRCNGTRHGR